MNENYYCVIMAGGPGSRFWPISRNSKPKQFLDILGTGKTFLQSTFERFSKIVAPENILVVTSTQYESIVREQLPVLKKENLLLEPFRRNTAPCMAYATYKLLTQNPNATVVVTPSDHLILDDELFTINITTALNFANTNDLLITLGIKPNRAESAYGYIQMNKNAPISINGNVAYHVKTFTEKPTIDLAEVFVNSGEFLWNSGIFIWNLKTIKEELERHQREMSISFAEGSSLYNTQDELAYITKVYEDCNNISIDYAIMEKTTKAVVYPVSFGWSDIGTWDSLFGHHQKDKNDNLIRCSQSMLSDVKNSIIISEDDKVVIASNLDNFMIVNTPDLILVCPREESEIKALFAELPIKGLGKLQ